MMRTHNSLKERHRELRDTLPESIRLRVHRALSWLKAAGEAARFIRVSRSGPMRRGVPEIGAGETGGFAKTLMPL